MQSALAKALAMTPPNQAFPPAVLKDSKYEAKVDEIEEQVKQAISECPDYDLIIPTLLQYDGTDLSFISRACHITPGVPVKPMLAKPSKGLAEVLRRFTDVNFTCEYKYDGMRAQIHVLQDGSIKLFSRNAEDFTEMYPDLVAFLKTHIDPVQECIIDSEVVAFDLETQRIRPFQDIQTRSRKNVELGDIKVQVCIFPFDILYLNGVSFLKETLLTRREVFFRTFTQSPGKFEFVQHRDMESFEDIETLLADSVKVGCEGLMVKTLTQSAQYEPSKRSFSWLKLKKDYLEQSIGDSVDLVPIGAFYGIVTTT
jgi:DNA ligase-1